MPKNQPSNNQTEKVMLTVLSLISVFLLMAIVYVWYNALSTNKSGSRPGDFLKTETTPPIENQTSTPSADQPTLAPTTPLFLNLETPQNESLTSVAKITVSGVSQGLAHLIIIGGREDVIAQADEEGLFSETVILEEGDNSLDVTVFNEMGSQVTRTVKVIYAP